MALASDFDIHEILDERSKRFVKANYRFSSLYKNVRFLELLALMTYAFILR